MCIYLYIYMYLYLYLYLYIYPYLYLMLSRLSWRAWHKDDLAQSMSTGEVTSKHTNLCLVSCAWSFANGQVRAAPEVTLYVSSTSSLAQCYLNLGILSLILSLSIYRESNHGEIIYIYIYILEAIYRGIIEREDWFKNFQNSFRGNILEG